MSIVVEYARPKVNLTLAIRGRRGDGYHELASLVAFASGGPADRIELDPAGPTGIRIEGPFASAIVGENLLQRVLDSVAPHLGGRSPGTVVLEKALPVAAGIGGGSADAAALLRALRRAFPDLDSGIDWQALALSLGADVPVCLAGTTTWMTGIGETLAPVTGMPALAAVLVNPCVAVPPDKTARVFRVLAAAALTNDTPIAAPPRIETDAARQIVELKSFDNDLTAAATQVVPKIGEVLAALSACEGCRLSRLSGAGPTAFGLFDDGISAEDAAAALRQARPDWWVTAATLG